MIEVPRGALTADEIANTAEFFSFGTNNLTHTCLGMSRDDSGSFLGAYTENKIVKVLADGHHLQAATLVIDRSSV